MTLVEPRPAPPAEHEEARGRLTARRVGWTGIALAFLAFFVALPPLTIRSAVPTVLLGVAAAACGFWAIRADDKRIGWGAIAAAVVGIAVALLGRNTALGTLVSALLFGSLLTGTSTRSLGESTFPPELAGNLTLIIQGLVILMVSADILVVYLWRLRGKLRRRAAPPAEAPA